jgi:hypothetical protein
VNKVSTEDSTIIKSGDSQEERNDTEYVDPLKDREDLQKALMDILHDFDILEEPNRNYGIRLWKKCENYWHHVQNIYWSASADDWKTPDYFKLQYPDTDLDETEMKIVNIYRAHGESIVAALSVSTPTIRYFPNDADNPTDVSTSKAYSKIAKMIERQNKAKLLLMRMIYVLFNQGMVAIHNYSHESEEYGTRQVPIYDKQKVNYANLLCPNCANVLSQHGPDLDGPIKFPPEVLNTPVNCPTCNNQVTPEVDAQERDEEYIKDYETKPKCRQRLAAYGPLNVKISSYAYDQKSVGILVFDSEQNYPRAQEMYPNIADKMRTGPMAEDVSVQARTPSTVQDAYNRANVTVRQVWMRPWMFNAFSKQGNPHNDDIVKRLKEIFPHGCCLHAVNDTYAESHKEDLDKAWSISWNPCDRFLQSDPVGLGLLPIQDIKNMVVNLSVESLEYGIPETFVDPEVLDLESYKQHRGGPGMVFPIKASIPGGDISKSFYTNKQATLTDEAGRMEARVDSSGQFVSGDYPSIYGGPVSGIGDTAAAYSMSRQQALQRLSTVWTIINFLWADVMKNSVEGFISTLKEDDYYVQEAEDNYINIWVRKSEVEGNIGEVFPEASEQFPTSWAQQREILLQLIQLQNPMIESVVTDPNNRTLVAHILGLTELTIPGDQDRRKQLAEISVLIQQDAITPQIPPGIDPKAVNPAELQPQTTVQPEENVDDHETHIQTCKHWLNSEVGQYFKETKPGRYMNVVLHMEAHQAMQQACKCSK